MNKQNKINKKYDKINNKPMLILANNKPQHKLTPAPNFSKYKFIPPTKIPHASNFSEQQDILAQINQNVNQKKAKIFNNDVPSQNFNVKSFHYQSLTQGDANISNENKYLEIYKILQQHNRNLSVKYESQEEATSPLKFNQNFNKKNKKTLNPDQCTNNKVRSSKNRCNTQHDQPNKTSNISYHSNVQSKQLFRSISSSKMPDYNTVKQDEIFQQNSELLLVKKQNLKAVRLVNTKSMVNINHNKSKQANPPKISENTIILAESGQRQQKKIKTINNKFEHEHIQKLTQFIHELRINQTGYHEQIQDLQHENKIMQQKLITLQKDGLQKQKIIQDLAQKVKQFEYQCSQKCHEHTLIIDSLKKIVSSQKTKILELQQKVCQMSDTHLNSMVSDQPLETPKIVMYNKKNPIHYQQPNVIWNDQQEQNSEQKQEKYDNELDLKEAPNFGIRTLDMSNPTFKEQENNDTESEDACSLLSSQNHQQNIQLSRIQQSAEEAECSTDFNQKPYQHQQLLNQIDQYLSKWNKRK